MHVVDDTLAQLILHAVPASRRGDILSLSRTSKALHTAANPALYSYVLLTDIRPATLFARTISANPGLASYTLTFTINFQTLDLTDAIKATVSQSRPFWEHIQRTLLCMPNLRMFLMAEASNMPVNVSWMLVPPNGFPFQLREAKLHMGFDRNVAAFLRRQRSLHHMQFYRFDRPLPPPPPPPGLGNEVVDEEDLVAEREGDEDGVGYIAMPSLIAYDGSLSVALHFFPQSVLLASPIPDNIIDTRPSAPLNLKHVQILVDTTTDVYTSFLNRLSLISKTLIGLSLLDAPPSQSLSTVLTVSHNLPYLRHLGLVHLPLPSPTPLPGPSTASFPPSNHYSRNQSNMTVSMDINARVNPFQTLLRAMMSLHYLRSLEADLSKWTPQPPNAPAAQKVLAASMKTMCPTLEVVVFWLGRTRYRWIWVSEDEEYAGEGDDAINEDGGESTERKRSGARRSVVFHNSALAGEWQVRVDTNQLPILGTSWYNIPG